MLFILEDDILKIQDMQKQNAGSINYYEADVQFNEKWEGLTIYAIITKEGITKGTERAVINNKLYIDQEFNGIYTIGFVGYTIEEGKKNYQISTNLRKIPFGEGAGEIETEEHKLPTPSEWEIYLNQIQQFINEGNEIINQANTLNIEMIQNEKSVNIILTKKDGTTEEYNIYDGKDYVLTEEDKQEILETVTPLIREEIQPILEENKDIAETAVSIAKGANQAIVFGDYETMINSFNNLPSDTYDKGKNILIITLNVPDLWISAIDAESVPYTFVDDETFTNELKTNGIVKVGYYVLSALETQKVDLSDYAKKGELPKVSYTYGIYKTTGGILFIDRATESAIDSRTSDYKPIVPSNLDYAVGSVKASGTQSGTLKAWTSENEDGEIGLNISTEV